MKKTGKLLAWALCLSGIFPLQAQRAANAPSDLHYMRLWSDSIRLLWNYPLATQTKKTQELPLTHTATYRLPGNYSETNHPRNPVSDGEYIYMSSWYSSGASVFYKYDLYGNYVESFTVEGVERSLRDLAYDGKYFYGGYEGINKIAIFDLPNHKLIGSIDVDEPVRHICYVPTLNNGKGGFEVGDWGSSRFIDRNGKLLKDSAIAFHRPDLEETGLTNAPDMEVYGTSYHNGKIYAHSALGIMEDMTVKPIIYNGPYSRITEYDAETGLPTGRRFCLPDYGNEFGLDAYNSACGINILEFPKGTFKFLLGFETIGPNKAPLLILELESAPLPTDLDGYNLYADGKKINAQPIDRKAHSYELGGLVQGKDIDYELKAVYGNTESEAASLKVHLSDSRLLPFFEDFNSLSLNTNYWKVKDTAKIPGNPWNIKSFRSANPEEPDVLCLEYWSGSANMAYSSTLVSKPLNLKDNRQVLLRYQTGLSVPFVKPPFCDTIFLEAYTGNIWVEIDRDTTQGNGKTLSYKTIDISRQLAGKENVRFRFRVQGNSRTEENPSGYSYQILIDNFKVWEPVYVNASGSVKFNGTAVENAKVLLTKLNDVLIYESSTDAQGRFAFENIETGTYSLTAMRTDYNTYIQTVTIDKGTDGLDINLLQPAFSTKTDTLQITMKPNETLRSGFYLGNSGTGPMAWEASFNFPTEKSKADKRAPGIQDIPLVASWNARGNVEKSYAYLNGTIYSFYWNGTAYELLETQKDGTPLQEGTILPLSGRFPQPTCLFADKTNLYLTILNKIYRYDLESGSFSDTINTGLSGNIQYAAWNPTANTIFTGDGGATLLEIDMDGNQVNDYSVQYLGIKYIAVDPYSADKPVLWVTRNVKPEGALSVEYIGVFEYSLDSSKLTGRYFLANKHPQYAPPSGRMQTEIAGFFGTSEYMPGRFSLFVTTSLSMMGNPSGTNLCAVYDVAQAVKWIGMETWQGKLTAGETSRFYLNFDTEDLEHGDQKNCTVTLSADIKIKNYDLPVILTVDSAYENPCTAPSDIKHRTEGSEYVELTWKTETSGGALITEGLKGFSIKRNGVQLTDSLVTESFFRDTDPIMGLNIYEIQAFYVFPDYECNSSWSLPDSVRVVYEGTCATVEKLKATINNQRHVTLNWDYPINETLAGQFINESFETFEAFQTENIGNGWTSLDLDRSVTYGITDVEFPLHGEALPFIIFNPSKTKPSTLNRVDAYSGTQMLASFSSRLEGSRNNDWIISPELTDTLSLMTLYFMAKSAFFQYGYEELKVAYSTTGKNVEDFVYLNDGKTINVPGEWTEYSFKLPKGTRYVALNCVSLNKFMLLIDDIYIGPVRHHMRLESYSVYKNDVLLQEISARAFGFYDYALKDGEYAYTITANYNNGCISPKSEPEIVDIAFKHGITPARGLTASIDQKQQSINLSWKEPAWGETQQISYHNGMSYGFALSDFDGNKLPFYAAIKIDMDDPLLMDYSLSAIRIGFFDLCQAVAIVIDMEDGIYVAEQKIPYMNKGGFTTVSLDNPVKLELGKSYLVGFYVTDYEAGTFPAGQDDGPVLEMYGDYLSIDGYRWSTVSAEYNGEIKANWAIDALLEITEKPAKKNAGANDRKISFSEWKNRETSPARHTLQNTVSYQDALPKDNKPETAVEGYQLFRDGSSLQEEPQIVLHFDDTDVRENNTYTYWVKTFYENGQTINSDSITVLYSTVENEKGMEAEFNIRTSKKHILIENTGSTLYDVTVHGLNGVLLQNRCSVSENLLDMTMENAASGIYLVCIRQGNTMLVRKIYL